MDENDENLYKALTQDVKRFRLAPREIAQPDPTYDGAVRDMYTQAQKHRRTLVRFYIWYTSCFAVLVMALIFAQAAVRLKTNDTRFEIMPQWSLDILVTGMFGQFLGLLKIVTENVWNFKSFFDHHNEMRNTKTKK